MENSDFSSFKYVVGNHFVHRHKVVVKVFFIYQKRKVGKRVLSIEKKKNANDSYYIDEAKKIIAQEINSGYLAQFAGRNIPKIPASKRLKIAVATALCAVAVIGTGSFYAFRYINQNHQQEHILNKTIEAINNLNPNSTEAEIKSAIEMYETLPEDLKKSFPEETVEYLGKQVMLFELDKVEANKVDNITINFSIPTTTETELLRLEARINRLTPRAHTLLREGTDQLVHDVREAIETDKANAKAINDAVEALDPNLATAEEVLVIIEATVELSDRGFSYIEKESIEKIQSLVNYWGIMVEILYDYLAPLAEEYATEGTLCTIDDIRALENIYNEYFTTSMKEFADGEPYYFSRNIKVAKALWLRDDSYATQLGELAAALDPKTCLDEDIKEVTDAYEEKAINQRIKNLAEERGYSANLKKAENALNVDKEATKKFYEQEVLIINDTCTQEDINKVEADYDAYYKTATVRLQKLITREPYDLKAKLDDAQRKYTEDYNTAKEYYNEHVKLLTPDITEADLMTLSSEFNEYLDRAKVRVKRFLDIGGEFDFWAKLNEANELLKKDKATANLFNTAVTNLPDTFEAMNNQQKMIMESAKVYRDEGYKIGDDYYPFFNTRAKTLIESGLNAKLDSLRRPDKFKFVVMPAFRTLANFDLRPFECDNVPKFDPNIGLYVSMTRRDVDYYPCMTTIMGDDYNNIYKEPGNYNHVLYQIYTPADAGCSTVQHLCHYPSSITTEAVDVGSLTKGQYTTYDITTPSGYGSKYDGLEVSLNSLGKNDVGKEFRITGHYLYSSN